MESVEPPEPCRIFLLRHRCREEGGLALIDDASSDKQASVSFYRQFLGNIGSVAKWFWIIASLEAGTMDRDVIQIAGDSILRLQVQLVSCNGSVMPVDQFKRVVVQEFHANGVLQNIGGRCYPQHRI